MSPFTLPLDRSLSASLRFGLTYLTPIGVSSEALAGTENQRGGEGDGGGGGGGV